ncbi:MAG: adenine deaminase [Myxococcota bacterium]
MTISLADKIGYARGEKQVDLLVKGGRLINVLSGEVYAADIAVADGIVVGFGDYEAKKTIDASGLYISPGLIEGHIHIESAMLSPPRFAEAVAAHGTAAVVCDPHEIANVLGLDGIRYMIESSEGLPVSIFFMMPSCVPATHLETAGAKITAGDIERFIKKYPDRILGLAELMNFPGVLFRVPEVLEKIIAAGARSIDGHAPLLTGKDLSAYIIAGAASDHESTRLDEAREKLRKGMHLMIREGTTEKNLDELIGVVNEFNSSRVSLVSDDRHPNDLLEKGHLDYSIRRAISAGLPPVRAVQMATINTAGFYGLRGRGALAPGYRADFLLVEDLVEFKINSVYLGGREISELSFESGIKEPPRNTMNIKKLSAEIFKIKAGGNKVAAIAVLAGQILTKRLDIEPRLSDGFAEADAERDIAKLAVIERHKATGNAGLCFVKGLGLKRGALAGTVAHDSHNLIVAGMNDDDMLAAAEAVVKMGGGFAVAENGKATASLPLPIAGLMSDKPAPYVAAEMERLNKSAESLGGGLRHPFMALSFLALPVIPELKLTDRGLVDVGRFDFIDMWGE